MSEQRTYDRCDHCQEPGELGTNMRAHAVEIPGKTARVVRLLHAERCAAEWFAKYSVWLKQKGARNANKSD